jgi:Tfp pilus assembly protein PilZ
MSENGIERRTCLRFEIPGATISYKISKLLPAALDKYEEEFCPMLDISRGGLRFQANHKLDIESKLIIHISVPGERVPLVLNGRVRWVISTDVPGFEYQIGVQFNAYGEKKDQNYPGNLVKIIALEQKFCPPDSAVRSQSDDGDYEIDG